MALFLLAAAVAVEVDPPEARSPPVESEAPSHPDYIEMRESAERMLAQGQTADAREALLALEAKGHRDSQLAFLLGMAALMAKDHGEAIRRFRDILAREPEAVRVRLELARSFYEKRDYRNAERQFQLVRAGNLPGAVRKKVDAYLATIRRERTFTFDLSIGVAPDTNVNASPSVDQVSLFGLPFALSPDAKAKSGIGLAVGSQINWSPHVSKQLRWDVIGSGFTRRYAEARFSETVLAAATGPRLVREPFELSMHAKLSRRWFGGKPYAQSQGADVDGRYYMSGRTALTGSFELGRLRYPEVPAQNGSFFSMSAGALHALGPTSFGRLAMSYGRENARDKAFASGSVRLEGGYAREFGRGITVNLAGAVRLTDYDRPLLAFGATRKDRQYVAQAGILSRRIQFLGFAPTLTLTQMINDSSIPLYKFKRTRSEIGLTRTF